jgi:hypothetical protein
MTIINNIEIDNVKYEKNTIKEAIVNNDCIEEKLHVIIVISNPCLYAKRYILAKQFMKKFECEESDVILYLVELIYEGQRFILTDKKNKRHLQLKTKKAIWHKENMINLGVKYLLPKTWKAFAWIDADIEFENVEWAKDTLKVLNGSKDIVQLFSHCVDMDQNNNTLNIFSSFGHNYINKKKYSTKSFDYWHPGFAWAITRKAYERIGGLYEYGILGSGDNIMALSLINNGLKALNSESTEEYKDSVFQYQSKIKNLRLGYIPGVIKHNFHGSKKNRRYTERWQILLKHNYNPEIHVTKDNVGILVPTSECPKELLDDIYNYFKERNEDEEFMENIPIVDPIIEDDTNEEAEDVEDSIFHDTE